MCAKVSKRSTKKVTWKNEDLAIEGIPEGLAEDIAEGIAVERSYEEAHAKRRMQVDDAKQKAKPSPHETKGGEGEEEKLLHRFPDWNKNLVVLEIVNALEVGELEIVNPEPKYFDALSRCMELYPQLPGGVCKIKIDLKNRKQDEYTDNIYHMPSVLAILMQQAEQLQEVSLHGFHPETLLAAVSGLRNRKHLRVVDLEDNALTTDDLLFVLRGLPPTTNSVNNLHINLNGNLLDNESEIGQLLFRYEESFSKVTLLKQNKGLLKAHLIECDRIESD